MNATGAPVVTLGPLPKGGDGILVTAPLNVTFLINCPNTTASALRGSTAAACEPTPAFTLAVDAFTCGVAMAHDGVLNGTTTPAVNLTGRMDDIHFNISLASTAIGNFSLSNLDMLFNMMLRAVALDLVSCVAGGRVVSHSFHSHAAPPCYAATPLPQINTKLSAGVAFPATFLGMELTNSQLEFGNHVATFSADVALAPSSNTAAALEGAASGDEVQQHNTATGISGVGRVHARR